MIETQTRHCGSSGNRSETMTLEQVVAEIKKLKTHPAGSDDYHGGYQDGRNDALSILEEALDNLPVEHMAVADYADRLFTLSGFMLLETYREKPEVTVTFPDLKEAQQFHNTLVDLSQQRSALSPTA
jgi:hypothetical protein